jgi:hypothetical protein
VVKVHRPRQYNMRARTPLDEGDEGPWFDF